MVTSYSQVRPVTREVRFFYEGQSKPALAAGIALYVKLLIINSYGIELRMSSR
nr:MAG TPA: hypothetical protein [Bacteriophage sp.]